jgi:hypothetical protein
MHILAFHSQKWVNVFYLLTVNRGIQVFSAPQRLRGLPGEPHHRFAPEVAFGSGD